MNTREKIAAREHNGGGVGVGESEGGVQLTYFDREGHITNNPAEGEEVHRCGLGSCFRYFFLKRFVIFFKKNCEFCFSSCFLLVQNGFKFLPQKKHSWLFSLFLPLFKE